MADAKLEEELGDLERRRLRFLVEVRVEEADALHAPDFQLVHPDGGVWSKDEYLGGIATGRIAYRRFEPTSGIEVMVDGGLAVLRYRSAIDIAVLGRHRVEARIAGGLLARSEPGTLSSGRAAGRIVRRDRARRRAIARAGPRFRPMDDGLRRAIEADLGARITRAVPVHGGDVALAYAVELDDDRRVFAKTHPSAPPGFFTTEATGLSWLRAADAVAVPEVLAVSDDPPNRLVLEWIDEGRTRPSTERDLGAGLARVHRAGAPAFGREDRRSTGSRGLPNEPCATWSEFYAANRLLPLARLARESGALAPSTIGNLEGLARRLAAFDTGEPPARLHGDLWAGNRLVGADGRSWLIDPAAHGGHREFDLAMMRLFGGFGDACFAAYAESYPLEPGWEGRVALHQIAPLVVHAIKFGGGYVGAATAAIAQYT